jgi:hypothetical protein
MKRGAQSYLKLSAMLAVMASAGMLRGFAAPPSAPAADVPPPKSIFILPSKPQEGRDPFFPDSTRPYEVFAALNSVTTPTATDLVVNTILVNQHNQAFALINNQTFGVGDEGDVITSTGRRIHIQCVSIDPANGKVTVQFGDVTVTLTYSGN